MRTPGKDRQLVIVWLVIIIWVLALSQIVQSWTNYVNVSDNIGSSRSPAIAVDSGNTIHLVWSDNSPNYPGNYEILYKTSSNGGATWSAEQNLSNSAGFSRNPVIAAAGPGRVVVAWSDDNRTYARVWNGNAWSASTQLSTTAMTTQRLSAAINQDGVALVAWSEGSTIERYGTGGPPPEGYLYSRWNGAAWSAPAAQAGRLVAMRGNLAYLVTSQATLLRSTNAGLTWESPIALPGSYLAPDAMQIDSQNRLHMAWFSPDQVYAGMYDGQGFQSAIKIGTWDEPNTQRQLDLAVNGSDQVAIIWTATGRIPYNGYAGAYRQGFQVLASLSADGVTWSTPADVVPPIACTIVAGAIGSTIAGSPTSSWFYGTWQTKPCSPTLAPDIYIAFQDGVPAPGPVFSISGSVHEPGGAPIAGVTVSAGASGNATTDIAGTYAITGLITGTYTLIASKNGYTFSDPRTVSVPPNKTEQDFTGTSGTAEKTPLIFIPGIMGSSLYEDRSNDTLGDQFWPGQPLWCTDHTQLALTTGRQFAAGDAIRRHTTDCVPVWAGDNTDNDTYESFLNTVKSWGYTEYIVGATLSRRTAAGCDITQTSATLFVFAYDWRQSNAVSAAALREFVRCVKRLHPAADGVHIVTHSMGGLVARRYIIDYAALEPPARIDLLPVKRLITMVAPWLGAPRAIDILQRGVYPPFAVTDKAGLGGLMTPGELRDIARTFPGAHELLPSETYTNRYPELRFREKGWDYDGDGIANEPPYDYPGLIYALNHAFAHNAGTNNRLFHTAGQDDWDASSGGTQYYHIIGLRPGDSTVRGVNALKSCRRLRGQCIWELQFEFRWGPGDGTVPFESARRPGSGATWLEVRAEDGDGIADHTELVKNSRVQACIRSILLATPNCDALAPRMASTQLQADPAQESYYATISGAQSIAVADAFGNVTDTAGDPNNPASIPVTVPVPDLDLYIAGEASYQAVVPATQSYTLTLRSGDLPIVVDVRRGTGSTSAAAIRYRDIMLPANTTALLVFTPQGFDVLRYDGDGDGIFETPVAPTANVTGASANDLDSPEVAVTATGPLDAKVVTITATDAGAGVKELVYSLDGTHFQPYTGSIQVNTLQTPVVYAFADDNVANRSGLVIYQLAQRGYLPLIHR